MVQDAQETADQTLLQKKTPTSSVLQSIHSVDKALTISFKLESLLLIAVQHSFVDKSYRSSRLLVFRTTILRYRLLDKQNSQAVMNNLLLSSVQWVLLLKNTISSVLTWSELVLSKMRYCSSTLPMTLQSRESLHHVLL